MSSQDYIYCYQGKALRVAGGTAVIGEVYHYVDPYNPLGLPTNVFRCKYQQGYDPTVMVGIAFDAVTLVDATENVWDITNPNAMCCGINWSTFDMYKIPVIEVLGANTTDFHTDTKSVNGLFVPYVGNSGDEPTLVRCPVFDTRHITDFSQMFAGNSLLEEVPLLPTDSATNVTQMFQGCTNVQSGALAMYQQMASNTRITYHNYAFANCGSNTVTGAAELAQIPTSWGGTMA